VASLSQGRTAAAQCGLFTYKSVPVIFEPPCTFGCQWYLMYSIFIWLSLSIKASSQASTCLCKNRSQGTAKDEKLMLCNQYVWFMYACMFM